MHAATFVAGMSNPENPADDNYFFSKYLSTQKDSP